MPKTMTLQRPSHRDIIKVPMMYFNPMTEHGEGFKGDLDTGNDHTCVHPRVLEKVGVVSNGRHLPIQGVTRDILRAGWNGDDGVHGRQRRHAYRA